MTREDAIKYFERKLRNFEKSMETADRRGDEGAVGLRPAGADDQQRDPAGKAHPQRGERVMKARINLPTELQREARKSVARQIRLESCYVTESLVCLAALVLADEYGFGRKRLEEYCERLHKKVHEMVGRYGDDWPDAAMSALKEKGVEILDDGWIAERQWYIDKSKPREPDPVVPLKLHGELERFRRALEEQG